MKKKISKILGVVLSLALLSSLAMMSAPVAAAPGTNAWGEIDMPAVAPSTGVGVMAVAPDGTIYAAVLNAAGSSNWSVWKTADEGVTWTATSFTGSGTRISDIAISPNYAEDGTIYIARMNGDIFRMTGEGADLPMLLKPCVDSDGNTANTVYDIDLWYDGSDVWVLAGTSVDVLVLKDNPWFEEWRDQELNPPPAETDAYEVAFAPDFSSSNLIWAVVDNGMGRALVTSTVSPGQWGLTIDEIVLQKQGGAWVTASEHVDIAFPDGYTSSAPLLYVGCTDLGGGTDDGNLFMIAGAIMPGVTESTPLLPVNDDIVSVEVSGNVILAGSYNSRILYVSYNAGDTFTPSPKRPAGMMRFYVYMAPGAFDPATGVAYCSSQSSNFDESSFSVTEDGAWTWNQRSWVDTVWAGIDGLAFSPEGASQPALLINWGSYDSLWRTDDITAASPVWERVQCTQVMPLVAFYEVEYSQNYATDQTIMLYGMDSGGYLEIWKSTDNAQTFAHWRTLPTDVGGINELVVYNSATIYAACNGAYGFYGTSLFGPATKELSGVNAVSIALQPGFDPDDADNATIAVGDDGGGIWISPDGGDNWSLTPTLVGGAVDVYVAFDADFADNGLLYYATGSSTVGYGTVAGAVFTDKGALEDSVPGTATATSFSGIQVASDNALYALGGDVTVTPPTTATVISGDIVLTGTSTAEADVTLSNVLVTVLQGAFVDGEDIDIGTPNNDLVATGYNTVEGTIYVVDNAGPDAAAYTALVTFTGLTLNDVTTPFDVGEVVTVSEGVADDLAIDIDYEVDAGGTVAGETNLFRLLLHEDDNVWETARLDGAAGLWLTEGSNFVWTIGAPVTGLLTPTVWALEDTLSGPVTGVAVSSIGETSAALSWDAMVGASLTYEYKYDTAGDITASTSKTLTGLTDNTLYAAKVRVATQLDDPFPWSSRWSAAASFTTLEAIAIPDPEVPAQGLQDAPLLPSFVWEGVSNAVSYEFELGIDPTFATTIVSTTITAPTTAYTCTTELVYDTDHYWRVRAVSATGTYSDWCTTQNFHTMMEPIEPLPPVTIPPAPTPTIILPAPEVTVVVPDITVVPPPVTVIPPDVTVVPPEVVVNIPPAPPVVTITQVEPNIVMPEEVTPVYIWIIVAIGALLTVAVIVLIIRTRRVV